ncbi:TraR/DksA C4-type zinc finger protein [Edwardsiella anguillarum]|uniref:TraR/DksA C4-type zinc finger protein n=1 Tax=Edwardsiella anguillarum TaxID=1821960 RepID=UPI00054CCA72|nr:TraR/DksA C4-type zinc finger protein [Edwardsiella anguillarum]KAB0589409.1 TraR/DksA family transcriptional regulator [Edwardsiella anguillarum]WHQ26757.1 TraR/DksA C4-type zinc finger protein [Edwardsiella anguillarum]
MDDFDRAAEIEARFQAESLAAQLRKAHPALPVTACRECEDCGQLIPVQRLAIVPTAVCCIDCQRLREVRRV